MSNKRLMTSTKSRRRQLIAAWEKHNTEKNQITFYAVQDAIWYGLNTDWAALGSDAPVRAFTIGDDSVKLELLEYKSGGASKIEDYGPLNSFNKALRKWHDSLGEPEAAAALKNLRLKTRQLLESERQLATEVVARRYSPVRQG